jgi:hypothetical protein
MSLSRDCFSNGLVELEDFYTKFLSEFVKEAWYKKISHLTDEQFVNAVSEAVCSCQFMPTAEKLIEFAGADRFPGETGELYQQNLERVALPSTEINVDVLTDEQRAANIRRIIEEVAARMDMKKLHKHSSNEVLHVPCASPTGEGETPKAMLHFLGDNATTTTTNQPKQSLSHRPTRSVSRLRRGDAKGVGAACPQDSQSSVSAIEKGRRNHAMPHFLGDKCDNKHSR